MATYKYLYWRPDMGEKDGKVFANVHYLVGYTQQSLADYKKLARIIKKDFPEATEKDIMCSKVTQSHYCHNFTLIALNTWIEKKDYPEWREMVKPDYSFA
jgi:hypothetical protein